MKLLNCAPFKVGDKVRGYWTGWNAWTITQIEYRRGCWHINVSENRQGWWLDNMDHWEKAT